MTWQNDVSDFWDILQNLSFVCASKPWMVGEWYNDMNFTLKSSADIIFPKHFSHPCAKSQHMHHTPNAANSIWRPAITARYLVCSMWLSKERNLSLYSGSGGGSMIIILISMVSYDKGILLENRWLESTSWNPDQEISVKNWESRE